jgi:crossover junction endodeoxyribonuclease RuvC
VIILGIDPGAGGALAFCNFEKGLLDIVDMPTVQVKRMTSIKNEISPAMLAAIINVRRPDVAWLERVGAMPGNGGSSMFQFGRGVGMIEGALAALEIPVHYITPAKWQRGVQQRQGKGGGRERASQLFPVYASMFLRAKDDGRSDAALIAYYGFTNPGAAG